MKYRVMFKQYAISGGTILVYMDGDVMFVPNKEDSDEMDFDNAEMAEFVNEDSEDFEEADEQGEEGDESGIADDD